MKSKIFFISVTIILAIAFGAFNFLSPSASFQPKSEQLSTLQQTKSATLQSQSTKKTDLIAEQPSQQNIRAASLTQDKPTSADPGKQIEAADPEKTIFRSDDYRQLLFSDDTSLIVAAKQDFKTTESMEHEHYLQQVFLDWQQQNPQYNTIRLDVAECDKNACFVSLAGVERLTELQLQQLEDELLFNKQKFSGITAAGTGGTYGIYDDGNTKHFRLVYVTNEHFRGIHWEHNEQQPVYAAQ